MGRGTTCSRNPKVKKDPPAEKQLMLTGRKVHKADAVVAEAEAEIQRRQLELEAQQEVINQKAQAVVEAQLLKAEALKAQAAAVKEAEEARVLYFARAPDKGANLFRDLLARMGGTDLTTLSPEQHADVLTIENTLNKLRDSAARSPPQPQPAEEPEAPSEQPAEEDASSNSQQQGCPAPPPHKKGKGAAGTPCAKPPKDDDDTRLRKVPDIGDSHMESEDRAGEATPAPSCS